MRKLFRKHPKVGLAVGAIGVMVYGYCVFLKGIWYGNAFLYQKEGQRFVGKDAYSQYEMELAPSDAEKVVFFSVEGDKREYRILPYGEAQVRIYENGVLALESTVINGIQWDYLEQELGEFQESDQPNQGQRYPSCTQLYNWAMGRGLTQRGNLPLLIPLLLCAVSLGLDIAFPDLFFYLRHGLSVDNATPSEWYRTGQKISRLILAVACLCLAAAVFLTH